MVVHTMPPQDVANILELSALAVAIPAHVDLDRQLIERFQSGDREAFTALYVAHNPAVFRFAFHMTADPVKAAEIAQDVFVWLMEHPAKFNADRGGLSAFLLGVARKVIQRRQRSERIWVAFERDAATRDSGVDQALDADTLRKAIALLPITYREAIVLCDIESKTYDEAAALLGCALGTIRSRLHRGRELLARKFESKKGPRP